MSVSSKKAGRPPVLSNAILLALKANPGSTVKDLNDNGISVQSALMNMLKRQDLIKVAGKVNTGMKGRPAYQFRLTDAGRNRVRRIQRAEASQTVVV